MRVLSGVLATICITGTLLVPAATAHDHCPPGHDSGHRYCEHKAKHHTEDSGGAPLSPAARAAAVTARPSS